MFLLVAFGVVFGLGYYTGQRPDEVKQKLRDLSGEVLEQTIGLDQGLSLRKEFLKAKERLLEGKSQLLDHEYEGAATELSRAVHHLAQAKAVGSDTKLGKQIEELMNDVEQAQKQLAEGRGISRQALDEVQARLNDLLS